MKTLPTCLNCKQTRTYWTFTIVIGIGTTLKKRHIKVIKNVHYVKDVRSPSSWNQCGSTPVIRVPRYIILYRNRIDWYLPNTIIYAHNIILFAYTALFDVLYFTVYDIIMLSIIVNPILFQLLDIYVIIIL